ncbi:hypothetical protein [Methylogaea oryzae]|uniref:DUF4148 domain-containing protein n=2 Tax=Methylogaea oryzae TaxID=1295382 RepID=A0A8D5AI35_9GAMM|nr:hypothetical protein [Methylogaea oryzae]BBL72103.1 hypothetical protein MoryE10_27090 [Methylogaea oryzae]
MRSLIILLLVAPAFVQAEEIKPYQAQEIQPYQAQRVPQQRSDQGVQPFVAQEVKPYQAQTVKPVTKEELARARMQIEQEAKRIARTRGAATTPEQLYWQQQMMHRQMEATNPDITYHGR